MPVIVNATRSTRTDEDYQNMLFSIRAVDSGTARKIRESAGVSIAELARRVGVTHTCIIYWEKGVRQPSDWSAITYGRELQRLQRSTSL